MGASKDKGKIDTPTRNRDFKCFRCLGNCHIASHCPNKKAMITLASGEVGTDNESEEDEMPSAGEASEEEIGPVDGEALVIRRSLSTQVKEDDLEQQRDNIFHTRCHVSNKVCSVIIDGGSCTNVASTTLVEILGLATFEHPNPYKLQWLNDSGEVKVN